MAAGMERLDEYKTHNAQFCNRLWGYLQIAFTYQVRLFAVINRLDLTAQLSMSRTGERDLAQPGEVQRLWKGGKTTTYPPRPQGARGLSWEVLWVDALSQRDGRRQVL